MAIRYQGPAQCDWCEALDQSVHPEEMQPDEWIQVCEKCCDAAGIEEGK